MDQEETPPVIIERRVKQNSTLYGNVMDLSGDAGGYIKGATQEGGLEDGYGLLQIQTAKGTDPASRRIARRRTRRPALRPTAQQAFLMMNAKDVRAMYLGGGKTLKAAGTSIECSEPGLAYVENLGNGTYVVGNPSPSDATVTVTLPGVAGANPFTAKLKAGDKVELAAIGR